MLKPNFPKDKIRRNFSEISTVLVLFILSAAGFYILSQNPKDTDKTTLVQNQSQPSPKQTPSPKTEKLNEIDSYLQNEAAKIRGNVSFYVKDLKSQKTYGVNQNKILKLASVYKLAIMYKTFSELEKGTLNKTDKIAKTSISEALNLMITVSDNESAISLAEKFGWAEVDKYIKSEGAKNFNLISKDEPSSDAVSVSVILEKIYYKSAVSQNASQEMLNLLLNQKINDRIPKYLPKDIKVAHKTGELDGTRNDAGIVFGKKSDYVFVFLTDTESPLDTLENLAIISKGLFDLLEN